MRYGLELLLLTSKLPHRCNSLHSQMISQYLDQLLISGSVSLISLDCPDWKWEVIEKIDDDNYLSKVSSPLCLDGEYGYVDMTQLNNEITMMIE